MSGGVQTRSQVAVAARHPQAESAFKEGMQSVFRQWTALELAVHHQWGGPSTSARVDELVEEIMAMFRGPEKIYKDDITIILEDYLETYFNTICEDGSPDELGDLLVTMWRQCVAGDFTLVTNSLAREYVRHEMVSRSQGLSNTGDAMDSDEEREEGAAGGAADLAAIAEDGDEADGTAMDAVEEVEEPRVDPDGWETVKRGKAKGKKGK